MYKVIAKQCTKCKLIKLLDDYTNKKGGIFNKNSMCRSCKKINDTARKAKLAENREAIKQSMVIKICPKCKLEKSVSEFYNSNETKDGYSSWCKECNYISSKKYNEKNRDKIRDNAQRWRDENREHYRNVCRKYYTENKEHCDEVTRRSHEKNKEEYKPRRQQLNRMWYSANKKHRNELSNEWYRNNKDKVLATTHRRLREYGFNPINQPFIGSAAHHTWLSEASDMVIYIPNFIHTMYPHNHFKPETMYEINCVSMDYWINEDLYQMLFFDEAEKEHEKLILDSLYSGMLSFAEAAEILNTTEQEIKRATTSLVIS